MRASRLCCKWQNTENYHTIEEYQNIEDQNIEVVCDGHGRLVEIVSDDEYQIIRAVLRGSYISCNDFPPL